MQIFHKNPRDTHIKIIQKQNYKRNFHKMITYINPYFSHEGIQLTSQLIFC